MELWTPSRVRETSELSGGARERSTVRVPTCDKTEYSTVYGPAPATRDDRSINIQHEHPAWPCRVEAKKSSQSSRWPLPQGARRPCAVALAALRTDALADLLLGRSPI